MGGGTPDRVCSSGASFLELKALTKDFFPDLLELFEGEVGLRRAPPVAPAELGPAWSPELELWLLVKEDDLVVSLLLVLESVSLLELVLVVLVLVLLFLEELLTTPLLFSLSLSLSLSLKNLNLSNMEFLLLDGGLEEVLLLEDDVELVEPALVLLDCFSASVWLLEVGIPRPIGVGMAEWDAAGEVARADPPELELLDRRGISDAEPVSEDKGEIFYNIYFRILKKKKKWKLEKQKLVNKKKKKDPDKRI